MPKTDPYESEVLAAFEQGRLKSVATKAELAKLKAAARSTAIKDRRVNIRLSTGDLQDIQIKALQEGLPYQTLIASVLHKYVSGRLTERGSHAASDRVLAKVPVRPPVAGDEMPAKARKGAAPKRGSRSRLHG